MNKKGFTLIELLAVIVVLAVIALIATPIVMRLINDAQEAVNARSVEGYMKAYRTKYHNYMLENGGVEPTETLVLTKKDYSGATVICESITVIEGEFTAICSVEGHDGRYKYENGKAEKIGSGSVEESTPNQPEEPTATLEGISAVFTQGDNVIYTIDNLDTLKQYLVVNAIYDDGTSQVVTNYTLSGELNEGSNVITVSYNGKATTFEVEVEVLSYTLYNSLTSDGNAYIDTGVMANQDTKFEIKYNFNNATTSGSDGIGVLAAYSNNNTALFGINTFQGRWYYSYGEEYYNFTLGNTTEDKVATNNKGTLVINGEQVVTIEDKTFTQKHSLYMFALSNSGNLDFKANRLKIYYCKIWDGDTLIRDFVPAMRNSDGVVGMLDKVNNVFYTSEDTGTFTIE